MVDEVPTVTLTSGEVVPTPLVTGVMLWLDVWFKDGVKGATLIYDVAMMSRNPNYKPDRRNAASIAESGLVDDFTGDLHRATATIVKCAVVGEGLDLYVTNPVAEVK